MTSLAVAEYERVEYDEGVELQRRLVELRKAGAIGDTLLLLEHSPVITLGRNARAQHILAPPEQLARRGIQVAECDRGGDVTYHGPGQLVGYPIIDLRQCPRPQFLPQRDRAAGIGPVDYVRALEEVLIRTAASFAIPAKRVTGLTGVWTDDVTPRKLAAIGVHVSRGVTSHGFALNISTDLSAFQTIVPCGIADRGVTSMARETGRGLKGAEVTDAVLRQFCSVFGYQIVRLPGDTAWTGHEQSGPPLPSLEARPQRPTGASQKKAAEPQSSLPALQREMVHG